MPNPFKKVNSAGKRIAVIDDDLAIRVLLETVLQRLGFDVALAADGAAGLELVRNGEFDLVLLDLMMPTLNGYEFLEQFHTEEARAHVIVFTAAGPRGVSKIPENSICASIQKPFDLETFIQLVSSCADGSHDATSSSSGS